MDRSKLSDVVLVVLGLFIVYDLVMVGLDALRGKPIFALVLAVVAVVGGVSFGYSLGMRSERKHWKALAGKWRPRR